MVRNGASKLIGSFTPNIRASPIDVRVTREIEEHLESERRREPRTAVRDWTSKGGSINRVDHLSQRVGQKGFLREADDDEHGAKRAAAFPARRKHALPELIHHLVPACDRSRDGLREEADVERVAIEGIKRRTPAPEIDQIHDVVEREETDAERKHNRQRIERLTNQCRECAGQKIRVFEESKEQQIADHSGRNDGGPPAGLK